MKWNVQRGLQLRQTSYASASAAKRGDVVLAVSHLSPVFFNNGSAVGPETFRKNTKNYDTNLSTQNQPQYVALLHELSTLA